jgi:hypothetical protein
VKALEKGLGELTKKNKRGKKDNRYTPKPGVGGFESLHSCQANQRLGKSA